MMEKIKILLAKLIAEKGTNPARLAEAAGLDNSAIRKILDGSVKGTPQIGTLYKISTALGVYINDLIPAEWQRPALQVLDPNILKEVVNLIFSETKEISEQVYPLEAKCVAIAQLYNEKIKERTSVNKIIELEDN